MSDFKLAIPITLKNEGGFEDHSATTGEVVNMGITLEFLRGIGVIKTSGPATPEDKAFVKSLTVDEVTQIYQEYFWDKPNIGALNDQDVAAKVFDVNVNTGHGIIFLQRALRVPQDNILGPLTAKQANDTDPKLLLARLRSFGVAYYASVRDRANAEGNLALAADYPGWITRLNS